MDIPNGEHDATILRVVFQDTEFDHVDNIGALWRITVAAPTKGAKDGPQGSQNSPGGPRDSPRKQQRGIRDLTRLWAEGPANN